MAYGIFIAENMASTKVGSLLRSAKQSTDIENGSVVVLGGLVAGENNVYSSGAVAAVTNKVAFVDGVELDADETTTKGLDDFINPANKPFRTRTPQVGDTFSISESMITGTATEGQLAEIPATGNKLKASATPTLNATFTAKVLKKWTFGSRAIPMVRLEVTQV